MRGGWGGGGEGWGLGWVGMILGCLRVSIDDGGEGKKNLKKRW